MDWAAVGLMVGECGLALVWMMLILLRESEWIWNWGMFSGGNWNLIEVM